MKRREFIKYLSLISGGLALPNELSANINKEELSSLKDLLGHDITVKPKKLILSLDDLDITTKEKKIAASIIKKNLVKYEIHKDKFSDRRLNLYNPHTGEIVNEVFWSEGKYINESLSKINHLMRDFRQNKVKKISLRAIEGLYTISKHTKKGRPLVINSAYRTQKTNRIVGGAKRSQHKLGKAIDFSLDKKDHTSLYSLKRFLIHHHNGGVGYYPRQAFIHIDAGDKRNWRG